MAGTRVGLADNWLRHVGDVAHKHAAVLDQAESESVRGARLCELNVIEQGVNVCETTVVQDACANGRSLAVHGWVDSLSDGRLQPLGVDVESNGQLMPAYQRAIATVSARSSRHE